MADTGREVMLMKAALLLPLITQSNTKYQQNEVLLFSLGDDFPLITRCSALSRNL